MEKVERMYYEIAALFKKRASVRTESRQSNKMEMSRLSEVFIFLTRKVTLVQM